MRTCRHEQWLSGDLEREARAAANAGRGDTARQRDGASRLQHARGHRERLLRDHRERRRALGPAPAARIRAALRRASAMTVSIGFTPEAVGKAEASTTTKPRTPR